MHAEGKAGARLTRMRELSACLPACVWGGGGRERVNGIEEGSQACSMHGVPTSPFSSGAGFLPTGLNAFMDHLSSCQQAGGVQV